MSSRVYSEHEKASRIFSDLLSHIARKGWFSAYPGTTDGSSLLYTSFHVHPDDADRVFALLEKSIQTYGGTTEWVLRRQQHNRFVMCPKQVSELGQALNNLSLAAAEIDESESELGLSAAKDLILFSDFVYRVYLRDRSYSWA